MVTSIRKEGPPDLYRVLYERPASHGRGLSFVRLGSARPNGGDAWRVTPRVAGAQQDYANHENDEHFVSPVLFSFRPNGSLLYTHLFKLHASSDFFHSSEMGLVISR